MDEQALSLRYFYANLVGDKVKMMQWLMDSGILAKRYICPKCGRDMKLAQKQDKHDGVAWKCKIQSGPLVGFHSVQRTVRKGTWFETSHLSFDKIVILTFMWITQWNYESISEELEASGTTVSDWTSYCRNVCFELCVNESEVLGGPGVIVEFYESVFVQLKLPREKKREEEWVFSGIEPATAKFFICVVPRCSKNALVKVIKEWIKPGTIVLSDCWNTYDFFEDDEFSELRENSSIEFNSLSESESDTLESNSQSQWNEIKKSLSSPQFNIHFFEYIWRQKHKNDPCMFMSFMNGVTNVFPPQCQDVPFPGNQVLST
ncbi:uncharacterized protein LOC131954116 [Physella acuta]|uniref:uncharacterized protein LOC131954116 n=1 Tax=Physella acuta TaxID=109671 RepID=UPI0027DD45D4|nr:uncharacterized protein LOC131954116 [Physella acuta]